MIIPDNDSKGPARETDLFATTTPGNDIAHVGSSHSTGSQPMVPGSTSNDEEGLPPYTPRETDPLLPHANLVRRPERKGRHSMNVLLALLTSVLATLAIVVIIFSLLSKRSYENAVVCHYADTWTVQNQTQSDFHHAMTHLDLPGGLESWRFISGCRDCMVNVSMRPSLDEHDMNIRMHLRAKHRNMTYLHQMKLCSTALSNNTLSTTLHAPELPLTFAEFYSLELLVTFPRNKVVGGMPLMPEFMVVIPSAVNITVRDLMPYVYFGTFAVIAEDGDMSFHGVRTDRAVITTGRGSIDADFHASEYVKVTSANSFVNVNVTISRNTENTPEVSVRASGPTSLNINLQDTSEIVNWPLELEVYAYSSADQVDLHILGAPMESMIRAVAHAERGSAKLSMPPTFEGSFIMIHGRSAEINIDGHHMDPKKNGRRRQVTHERINDHRIVGRTWWEAGGGVQSHAWCSGNALNGSLYNGTSAGFVIAEHGSATLDL